MTDDEITEAINSGDMSHAVDLLREQSKVLAGRLALTRGLVEGSMAQTKRASAAAERASDQTERAMALLEGMTTEAKRHAERAEQLETDLEERELRRQRELARATITISGLEYDLSRAHAHHMFGDRAGGIGGVLDRVGALCYLRTHGLPEATPADLDTACEGLETPWGSGPVECEACANILRIYGGNPPGSEHAQVMCRDHDQHGRPRETDTEDIDF